MEEKKGKFIVLYGINNIGKSTLAKEIIKKLKKNHKVQYLKYPIYDLAPTGDILNNYLREKNIYQLTPREYQIIQALNRTHFEEKLKKILNSGINLICEDYIATSIAWGINHGINKNFLEKINSHLLKVDLAILLDGERFKKSIEKNHQHEKNEELTNKVRDTFLELAKSNNWQIINTNTEIENSSQKALKIIKKILR